MTVRVVTTPAGQALIAPEFDRARLEAQAAQLQACFEEIIGLKAQQAAQPKALRAPPARTSAPRASPPARKPS